MGQNFTKLVVYQTLDGLFRQSAAYSGEPTCPCLHPDRTSESETEDFLSATSGEDAGGEIQSAPPANSHTADDVRVYLRTFQSAGSYHEGDKSRNETTNEIDTLLAKLQGNNIVCLNSGGQLRLVEFNEVESTARSHGIRQSDFERVALIQDSIEAVPTIIPERNGILICLPGVRCLILPGSVFFFHLGSPFARESVRKSLESAISKLQQEQDYLNNLTLHSTNRSLTRINQDTYVRETSEISFVLIVWEMIGSVSESAIEDGSQKLCDKAYSLVPSACTVVSCSSKIEQVAEVKEKCLNFKYLTCHIKDTMKDTLDNRRQLFRLALSLQDSHNHDCHSELGNSMEHAHDLENQRDETKADREEALEKLSHILNRYKRCAEENELKQQKVLSCLSISAEGTAATLHKKGIYENRVTFFLGILIGILVSISMAIFF